MDMPMTAPTLGQERPIQYMYRPLSTPSEFRVLELLPGVGDDPVSYRLHTADWNRPPAYEAVSYAWGDVRRGYAAICDSFQHLISVSLRDGLMAMRLKDHSRMLWVDAICIDQKNTEERGQQVSHMRLIYQGATTVLVWLGLDLDFQGKKAFAMMKEIWEQCRERVPENHDMDESSLKSVDELWDLLPVHRLNKLHSDNPGSWNALVWLFSLPWFSRLWVIQEVNSNRNVQLLCGSCEISWDVAVLVACYIRRHATIYRNWGFPESSYANAYYMRRRFWHRKVSVPSLLHWGRSFKATESLDRVYALLGMASFTNMTAPWIADYSQSKRTLYENVASRCIREMQNLRLLTYSQHSQEDESFPSWVPQWDREALYDPIDNSLTKVRWNTWGSDKPLKDIEIADGVLKVTGVVFDVVKSVQPFIDVMWTPRHPDNPVVQFWKQQRIEPKPYPTGETALTAFSFVLAAGLGCDFRKASENRGEFNADFAAYIDHLLQSNTAYHPPDTYSPAHALGNRGNGNDYDDVIRLKCRNRALLHTESGYLGLGPVCQAGDYVCILQGGDVPFILRLNNGQYRLVGDAYIHGIMEGEAGNSSQVFTQKIFEIH